jgi:hypothetical protein
MPAGFQGLTSVPAAGTALDAMNRARRIGAAEAFMIAIR